MIDKKEVLKVLKRYEGRMNPAAYFSLEADIVNIEEHAEPKTGHWIMSDDGLYRPICDKCGAHPWKGYIPTVEEATEVFKYCPNCGAKMESEG